MLYVTPIHLFQAIDSFWLKNNPGQVVRLVSALASGMKRSIFFFSHQIRPICFPLLALRQHNTVKFNMVTVTKASTFDIPKILALHKSNLLKNLTPQDQQDGFLTIELSEQQFENLNKGLAIFAAKDNDQLLGFLVTQTVDTAISSSLVSTMIKRFPEALYRARPLSGYRAFIYGPVCVDKLHRGQGILESMFNVMLQTLKGQYDVGVAFVSKRNPRSFHAHHDKLGMQVVDTFEFNEERYSTLVFEV
jgi:hypothetical protein